jgi:hypothetical protein
MEKASEKVQLTAKQELELWLSGDVAESERVLAQFQSRATSEWSVCEAVEWDGLNAMVAERKLYLLRPVRMRLVDDDVELGEVLAKMLEIEEELTDRLLTWEPWFPNSTSVMANARRLAEARAMKEVVGRLKDMRKWMERDLAKAAKK